MPELEAGSSTIHRRGAEPSLIERFAIEGLYGYRSISLSSDYAATILIAKNGTGKTTLLGALDAFLRMQLSRLRNLEFSAIRCKLRGEEELVLSHSDVIDFLQIPTEGEMFKLASRISLSADTLFNFLMEEWPHEEDNLNTPHESKVYAAILSASNWNRRETVSLIARARESLMTRSPNINMIFNKLQIALSGVEIVYLPTYRRVELALRGDPREDPSRRKRPKFDVATGSLFTGEIQFGLSDISDRLSQMNQQIILASNIGYREISANIINELLDGSFDNESPAEEDVPHPEELKLFFERLERGRRTGPYMPVSIPNLQKIYSGDGVPQSSSRFLNYFLAKLTTVIRSTKDVELPVDGFIDSCNKYLSSGEPSTVIGVNKNQKAVDGKALRLNRTNLRVHVESIPERRKISLNALSSGEKQMISLFAKMFLYPRRKIVLIDEPELSLSIDWQKEILVDVLSAPLCVQVIAITHSPFVFDNELEPFARALSLSRDIISHSDEIITIDDDFIEGELDD